MSTSKGRILVTGGSGFLGSRLVQLMLSSGYTDIIVPRSHQCDLREQEQVRKLMADESPDLVIHLAANVGGIGANQANQGSFCYDNLVMGAHVLEESRRAGVGKVVIIGTICSYPKFTSVPFKEEDFWNGYPEETNAPYGLAKKILLVLAQAYRQQYGLKTIYLLLVNLYGPDDNFDLSTSHVIPALIRKCVEAKNSGATEITAWGDGTPTREFLYVEDAARAVLLATQQYDGAEPVNVGSGEEISIRDLTTMIAELTGFTGRINWDNTRPNGQPRRCVDSTRADQLFGFRAESTLRDGLRKTIDWFMGQECLSHSIA